MSTTESWQKKEVRQVGEVVTGTTPSTKKPEYYGNEYKLISPADLDNEKYVTTAHRMLSALGLEQCRILPKDAVLVGCIGNVGKIGMVADEKAATNQQINAIICNLDHDPHFVYYSLLYNRQRLEKAAVKTTLPILNKSNFERFDLDVPLLPAQRRIAYVLTTVQTAIEQQARLIALTRELKSALMHKLFTEGLRGEKQKETEIGLVPESWEVLPLGEIMDGTPKNGMYKPLEAYGAGTLILRINDFSNDGDVVTSASNRINADVSEITKYALQEGDIVTNRVNSLSHLGKTALVGMLTEPMLFESNMMKYRVDKSKALPSYIMRLLNSPIGKLQIVSSAKRAVAQSSINQGSLKAVLLPIPKLAVQAEIVGVIDTVIEKSEVHGRKKNLLEELFRTLLHQLMTGQTRVHDLDLPECITIS